jgi:hypothetical protein
VTAADLEAERRARLIAAHHAARKLSAAARRYATRTTVSVPDAEAIVHAFGEWAAAHRSALNDPHLRSEA